MKSYKQGDTVYNIHGQEAEYVARVPGGYVVMPLYEDPEGGQHRDNPQTWDQVFKVPPAEKLHADIAALDLELQGMRGELAETRQLLALERKAWDEARTLRKQHAALKHLDDALNGRITHVVVSNDEYDPPQILSRDKALCATDRHGSVYGTLRLLTLESSMKDGRVESLNWCLHHYSDDSGSRRYAILCTSYEEALKVAAKRIEAGWAGWRKKDSNRNDYVMQRFMETAQQLGLPIPEDVSSTIKSRAREQFEKNVAEAKKKLADQQAALAALLEKENAA